MLRYLELEGGKVDDDAATGVTTVCTYLSEIRLSNLPADTESLKTAPIHRPTDVKKNPTVSTNNMHPRHLFNENMGLRN